MFKLVLPALILGSLALLLGSCEAGLKKPTLAVKSARIARAMWDQTTVEVQVVVENPNPVPLIADRVIYEGFLEGKRVGEGTLKRRITLPANGKETVRLPVQLRYAELGDALDGLRGKKTWKWEVKGEVGADLSEQLKVSLPFSKEGTLPAPALPRVKIGNAGLEKVSLTEATAFVVVEIDNPNAFAIPGGELEAKLKLGRQTLDPVKVRVPRIASQKKKSLRLKQKLRLKNLGGVALEVASGKAVDAQLVGALTVGDHEVPLDLKLKLKK